MDELDKEMEFFIYLLEQYAFYKDSSADVILRQWDEAGISDFIYKMYLRYHSEALENAFDEIDAMLAQGHLPRS